MRLFSRGDAASEGGPETASEGCAEPGAGTGRFAWMFGMLWQLYLIFPLLGILNSPDPLWRWIGVAALVCFVVVFTVNFVVNRLWRQDRERPPAERWLFVGTLAVLAALTVPAGHLAALYVFVYVSVAVVATLGTVEMLVTVPVITVGACAVAALKGWDGWQFLVVTMLSTAAATWGISRVISQSIALSMANARIADLARAEERARLSRDLHDVLGHSLTVISVKAELASRIAEVDPARAAGEIGEVQQLARDALGEVRTTVAGYRAGSLAAELAGARTALAAAGIDAELPSAVDEVPGPRRQLFGWALREGVTNVVRHSGARLCRVTLTGRSIEIADDGVGPPASANGGHGLAGLGERVAAAEAQLVVGRAPEGGFLLRVTAG